MLSIAKNRKAYHDYFINDTFEAGLVLTGTEIKSIRQGHVQLKESYISIRDGEAWIKGMHIAPYDFGNRFNHDETRDRKLLLHSHEIKKLFKEIQLQGNTIVPLHLYLKNGRAKLEIGVAKGKHLYDKRATERDRSLKREAQKATKERYQ
ncbi:SsrA-binding protein [Erysipelothrix larvae]|uniref:SsrA-binding protein n=1 Tax=Erysipelothrix larvae TaxID=1514105 RepID=A0A0X8GYI8_9FIRM|nr:SsrA-binding protein SmpB [Erysipelothrix larvae]AMC92768.1 SsrA-binding protein [Erysipelothrix larvae]